VGMDKEGAFVPSAAGCRVISLCYFFFFLLLSSRVSPSVNLLEFDHSRLKKVDSGFSRGERYRSEWIFFKQYNADSHICIIIHI
jgi:hypothetical protein